MPLYGCKPRHLTWAGAEWVLAAVQEPVVWSGSVRTNLDPFGEYGHDGQLWEVLKDCGLEDQVRPGSGRLHSAL